MINGNSHHHYHHHHHHRHQIFSENLLDGFSNDSARSNCDSYATIPASSSSINSSSPRSLASCCGVNYIEHHVSKLDTVAGIAIKYGVEVADIRRMNGLVTDIQMFALETLKIPLLGRHRPSPIVLHGSIANGERTPTRRSHDDVLDSLKSLKSKPPRRVTPAMSSLHGYYGLSPPKRWGPLADGTEMAVYRSGRCLSLENVSLTRESPAFDTGFSLHRKSRSLVSLEKAEMINGNRSIAEAGDGSEANRSIRRRQKPDNDPSSQTTEVLMKDDSGGGFLGTIRKGLALRPKIGSMMKGDARQSSFPIGEFLNDVLVSIQKSSCTSNLQESESNGSIWPTIMWSLKPEAIVRPIFDGLPKPITLRRKAALD